MTDHGNGASDPLLQPVFLRTGHNVPQSGGNGSDDLLFRA